MAKEKNDYTSIQTDEEFAKKRPRTCENLGRISADRYQNAKETRNRRLHSRYTLVPNLVKLGLEITSFTFVNVARSCTEPGLSPQELSRRAHKWIGQNKNVIFAGTGEGIHGKNCIMVSLHRDFTDYTRFMSKFRQQWEKNILDVESFMVTLKGTMPKQFSFRHLEEIPE